MICCFLKIPKEIEFTLFSFLFFCIFHCRYDHQVHIMWWIYLKWKVQLINEVVCCQCNKSIKLWPKLVFLMDYSHLYQVVRWTKNFHIKLHTHTHALEKKNDHTWSYNKLIFEIGFDVEFSWFRKSKVWLLNSLRFFFCLTQLEN